MDQQRVMARVVEGAPVTEVMAPTPLKFSVEQRGATWSGGKRKIKVPSSNEPDAKVKGYAAAVAGTSRPTQPNVSLMGAVNDFLSNVTSRGPPGEKVYQERMLQFERRKEETKLRYEREMQAIKEEEQNYEYEFQLSQAIQKSINELLNVRAQFRGSRTPADSSAEGSSGTKEGAHSATPVSPRNSSLPTVMSKVTVAEASASAVSGAEASAEASDAEAPAEASDAEALAKASGAEAEAEANDSEASARLKGEGEGGSEPDEAIASGNDEELHDRLLEDDVEMKGKTDC
ncbi:tol-Pal system protein TolA-like [Watersipora subatra]|uniref:tol-Pal system protein TolA-like n=1 Tax=Watersipora subatra TaxID=2589382 RepID=UPI00355AFA64